MASSVKDILTEILVKKKQVKGDTRRIVGYIKQATSLDSKGYKDEKAKAQASYNYYKHSYKQNEISIENKTQAVRDKIVDNTKKMRTKIRELVSELLIKNGKLQREIEIFENEENSKALMFAKNEMIRLEAIIKSKEEPIILKSIAQRQAEFRVEENETDIKYLEKVMNEMDADEIELHTAKKVFEEMVAHRKAIDIHNRKVMEKQAYEVALEINARGYYDTEAAKEIFDNAFSRNVRGVPGTLSQENTN